MSVVDHPTAPPLELVRNWGGVGRLVDLPGPHPGLVHWVDYGGPAEGSDGDAETPMLLVHGLGGSHVNWALLAGLLRQRRHVYALDLAGFGLTPGDRTSSSVSDNADLVAHAIRKIVGRPVTLVGNSMGGMVSLIAAGRHPDLVERLVLLDPSVPTRRRAMDRQVAGMFLLYQIPRVGELVTQRVGTRSAEQRIRETTALCFAVPTRMDPAVAAAGVRLLAYRSGHVDTAEEAFLTAARSIVRTLGRRGGLRDVMASVTAPVLVIHGDQDRLVPVEAARVAAAEHPEWTLVVLPGIGHTPMLEAPDDVAGLVEDWVGIGSGDPMSSAADRSPTIRVDRPVDER